MQSACDNACRATTSGLGVLRRHAHRCRDRVRRAGARIELAPAARSARSRGSSSAPTIDHGAPGRRASTSSTTTSTAPAQPAVDRPLRLVKTVTGDISPKSVVSTDSGLVFAAEHDVSPHDDGVRPGRVAREDDPRRRRPRELRVSGPRRGVPRRAGRRRGESRSQVLLRHQLLDVRRQLRARRATTTAPARAGSHRASCTGSISRS